MSTAIIDHEKDQATAQVLVTSFSLQMPSFIQE